MVATSITSRSVIRSESCSTTFQRAHCCRCSSTQCTTLRYPRGVINVDTCICHDRHDARRCFDEGLGPLSFVACGDERTPPRVRDFRFQHRCEDNLPDALRAYANCHNGNWISADSVSRIALWKVWSVHRLRRPMVTCSLQDTGDAEALFCVSFF